MNVGNIEMGSNDGKKNSKSKKSAKTKAKVS